MLILIKWQNINCEKKIKNALSIKKLLCCFLGTEETCEGKI